MKTMTRRNPVSTAIQRLYDRRKVRYNQNMSKGKYKKAGLIVKPFNTWALRRANCYDYAFRRVPEDDLPNKTHPGDYYYKLENNRKNNDYDCENLADKVLKDATAMGDTVRRVPVQTVKCEEDEYLIRMHLGKRDGIIDDFHFVIRNTDVINHFVKPGETWKSIAMQYGTQESRIRRANRVPDNSQRPVTGTSIKIPLSFFSHKRGFSSSGTLLRDATGKVMTDGHNINLDYTKSEIDGIDYGKPCAAFCNKR